LDALDRARRLREEADLILRLLHFADVVGPYGRVVPTGSYYLDLMAYPDLDLYLSAVSVEQLFQIGARLAESPLVVQVVFERATEARLAGGLYLKPRIRYGDWGRPWKIDIWSLDDARIDELIEPMAGFKDKLTRELREQILRYKVSLLNSQFRTPKYSGYWIYRAFLDEGLADPRLVTDYLVAHGIRLE
jgi:hypothetical protein